MHLMRVVFAIACFVYVVFSIVSTVSHCWMQTVPSVEKNIKKGLFMECVEGEKECKDLPDDKKTEWYDDVRALAIVSCLFSSFALFIEIIHQTAEKVQKHFTVFLVFLSDLLLLIAVSMFTKKHNFDFGMYEYGWGFMLSWVAFVFGIGATVIGVVATCDRGTRSSVNLNGLPLEGNSKSKI